MDERIRAELDASRLDGIQAVSTLAALVAQCARPIKEVSRRWCNGSSRVSGALPKQRRALEEGCSRNPGNAR